MCSTSAGSERSCRLPLCLYLYRSCVAGDPRGRPCHRGSCSAGRPATSNCCLICGGIVSRQRCDFSPSFHPLGPSRDH
eukprot:1997112-Pyramimonas_sp.AAC.1